MTIKLIASKYSFHFNFLSLELQFFNSVTRSPILTKIDLYRQKIFKSCDMSMSYWDYVGLHCL